MLEAASADRALAASWLRTAELRDLPGLHPLFECLKASSTGQRAMPRSAARTGAVWRQG